MKEKYHEYQHPDAAKENFFPFDYLSDISSINSD